MAIPIECDECHRKYKVGDNLAGKQVKCKGCGNLIKVPGEAEPVDEELKDCLSCGAPMAAGTRICVKCGFNIQTGQKESLLLEDEAEKLKNKKKRQWVRKRGSPLLESLDELGKLILLLVVLAGIVVTIVHLVRFPGPEGFSFSTVLPTIVVLVSFAGITAPLAALAVNITVRAMKLANREDTYVRVVLTMMLPYSVGMIVGWPETQENWGWIATLSWPLAIGLLIYYLRAEMLEWIASLVAAVATMAISLIVVNLLGGAVNDVAGGMYADMLPPGPWTALAKGHSPLPAPPATRVATTGTGTGPGPIVAGGSVWPTTGAVTPATTVAATQEAPTTEAVAATAPVVPTTTVAGTGPATNSSGPMAPPVKMTSAYFASVVEEAGIREASAVVVPMAPAEWMLTVKNTETTSEVDRWSLNPLEKKEHLSYPFVARKAPQFALSAKGDAVAALAFFPRRQLDVMVFDGKGTKRSLVLDLPANIPDGAVGAMPTLLGIVDSAHYFVRWDMNGLSALQMFALPAGATVAAWRAAGLGAVAENSPPLLAPNGRTTAVFGKNQITFGNVDGGTPPKPILVASDPNVRLLGLAFSPDSGQIGVYAAVADLPTVMAFNVKTGEPVFTVLLSQTAVAKDAEVMPHGFLWLPTVGACLIEGNELVDAGTGRKFGTLGLAGVADAQVVSGGMVAFTFKTAEGMRTELAKLDEEKVRGAKGK